MVRSLELAKEAYGLHGFLDFCEACQPCVFLMSLPVYYATYSLSITVLMDLLFCLSNLCYVVLYYNYSLAAMLNTSALVLLPIPVFCSTHPVVSLVKPIQLTAYLLCTCTSAAECGWGNKQKTMLGSPFLSSSCFFPHGGTLIIYLSFHSLCTSGGVTLSTWEVERGNWEHLPCPPGDPAACGRCELTLPDPRGTCSFPTLTRTGLAGVAHWGLQC